MIPSKFGLYALKMTCHDVMLLCRQPNASAGFTSDMVPFHANYMGSSNILVSLISRKTHITTTEPTEPTLYLLLARPR